MIKKLSQVFTLFALAITPFVVVQPILAQQSEPLPIMVEEASPAAQNQGGEDTGPHFFGGENVTVDQDLQGDVYVGGGQVKITGNITGDVLVAGGQVTVSGDVSEDIRVAGGEVTIEGTVGKNVTAAAGRVYFSPDSVVNGSVVIGAGQADFAGTVSGKTMVGVGELVANGVFNQSIHGWVGNGQVGSQAQVVGDVSLMSEEEVNIHQEASIAGRRDIRVVEVKKEAEEAAKQSSKVGWFVFSLLSGLLAGAAFIYLFPDTTKTLSSYILEAPAATAGWGLVKLFLTPWVLVLLFLTVIGVPLAIIFLAKYLLLFMVSGWIVGYAVGQKVAEQSKAELLRSPFMQYAVGLLIVLVANRLPVIGGWVTFIVLLFGFGSVLQLEKAWISRVRNSARTVKKGKHE